MALQTGRRAFEQPVKREYSFDPPKYVHQAYASFLAPFMAPSIPVGLTSTDTECAGHPGLAMD